MFTNHDMVEVLFWTADGDCSSVILIYGFINNKKKSGNHYKKESLQTVFLCFNLFKIMITAIQNSDCKCKMISFSHVTAHFFSIAVL